MVGESGFLKNLTVAFSLGAAFPPKLLSKAKVPQVSEQDEAAQPVVVVFELYGPPA
ncbi:MAG TPA: hypothetical protein VFN84_03980 [Pseudolabrys sp.]|nr:hypothetical protein [Pseudolabrys sp.]